MDFGSVLSAGASILGGVLGGKGDSDAAANQFNWNAALQREFAQNGIRWRVADAKAAGIHPLYALGGGGPTFSPSTFIPGDSGNGLVEGLSKAGQDIGRAIDSTRTAEEKFEARRRDLQLENDELQNQYLRAQIAKLSNGQTGPALPSAMDGIGGPMASQGDIYKVNPVDIPATQPGHPSQGAGAFPETSWMRTETGMQPVPNREALEDADLANPSALSWYWRNQMLPSIGVSGDPPPDSMLPEGAIGWRWVPSKQEWQATDSFDFWDRNFYGKAREGLFGHNARPRPKPRNRAGIRRNTTGYRR